MLFITGPYIRENLYSSTGLVSFENLPVLTKNSSCYINFFRNNGILFTRLQDELKYLFTCPDQILSALDERMNAKAWPSYYTVTLSYVRIQPA